MRTELSRRRRWPSGCSALRTMVVRGYRAVIDPRQLRYTLTAVIRIRPAPGQPHAVVELAQADARDRGVSPHHRRMTATSPPPTCVTSATSQTSQETSGLARLASRLLTPGRFRRIMAATPTVSVGIRRPFGSLAADPGQVQGRLRVGLRPHEPRAVGERGGGDDRPSAASSRS